MIFLDGKQPDDNTAYHVQSGYTPLRRVCQTVICNPYRTTVQQSTDGKKTSTTHRTLQHICKPHKANAQTQAGKRAAILPTHPSLPTTPTNTLRKTFSN